MQVGVIVVLIGFLMIFFLRNREKQEVNNKAVLSGNKLEIFGDSYEFNGYPDKILVHYPYFMLVQANKPRTIVYDLKSNKKVEEVNDILLDYHEGNSIYNKKESFYNDKSLGEYCDAAFIKNTKEVLCITRKSRDSADNMLLNINPASPNLAKREYESKRILTGVYFIDNKLYVTEIDPKTMQNYISIDGNSISVKDTVNAVYPLRELIYYVSFPKKFGESSIYFHIVNGRAEYGKGDIVFN